MRLHMQLLEIGSGNQFRQGAGTDPATVGVFIGDSVVHLAMPCGAQR